MEAVRVRAAANGDVIGDELTALTIDDFELGLAVTAVETGTMNRSASILIQAGFTSRLAAIKAVTEAAATFGNGQELREWLNSELVAAFTALPDWPTAETAEMWRDFVQTFTPREKLKWSERGYLAEVEWSEEPPPPDTVVRLYHWNGLPIVLSSDGHPLGDFPYALNPDRRGLVRARVADDAGRLNLSYLGPDDLWLE